MHTKDARAGGETEQRLYGLTAWRESPFFTPRERAALGWTEAITNIQEGHATQAAYDEARKEFEEVGAGKTHFRNYHYQYLEPDRDRLSPRRRRLPARKIAAREEAESSFDPCIAAELCFPVRSLHQHLTE